jgi:hypothetical protein
MNIPGKFVLDTPADTVGCSINDTDDVSACLTDAIDYLHENLPDDIRSFITEKWGINDSAINARRIGYVGGDNDLIEYLTGEGYDALTIARAGLGTPGALKHVFECSGITTDGEHLVPDEWERGDGVRGTGGPVDESCPHTVPDVLDKLVLAQLADELEPEAIDVEAVAEHVEQYDDLRVYNWWDHRITFPYKNSDGEFCYLIGRATDDTDDIVYNNGIRDRVDEKVVTVADTVLGDEIPVDTDVLEEFVVLPFYESVFTNPDDDGNREAANDAVDTIVAFGDGVTGSDALLDVGVSHEPGAQRLAESMGASRVTVLDVTDDTPGIGTQLMLSPPAIGVEPGASLAFVNHTEYDVSLNVKGTPSGVWWDGGSFEDLGTLECSERGLYRYSVTVNTDDSEHRLQGMVIVYEDVYTDRRNQSVENWCEDEPAFEVDLAKYVKQTIDRSWINRDAVYEPIFGAGTVHAGKPLVVTEGVTDAIMAHQHNIPCVAPATTNFKQHHYDLICEHAAEVSTVFVVNDNEKNDAGINGALRTAKVIENDGHDTVVCELPRPDRVEKIDVAEYLKNHSQAEFIDVLQDGIPAEEHPKYDPARHDPAYHNTPRTAEYDAGDDRAVSNRDAGDVPETALQSDRTSAIYALELTDVIDFDALPTGNRGGSTIYRGENPIQHHGNSVGYFVIRDHGDFVTAKDFKIESRGDGYYYNALTWMACETSCDCPPQDRCDCTRSTTRPMGSLSDAEVFWVWKHAKEAEHIPVPADDPMPTKAMWFVARQHDLYPEDMIPESFDDDMQLARSVYNKVLKLVQDEYDVDPGRRRLELPAR